MIYPLVIGGIDQGRYPGHTSIVLNFCGCDLACRYCNAIRFVKSVGCRKLTTSEILNEIVEFMPMIDSVIMTGGEPTIHNLYPLAKLIKSQGLKIKLETNGQNPDLIARLCREKLVDTVSLDMKGSKFNVKLAELLTGKGEEYFHNIDETLAGISCDLEIVFPVIPYVTDDPRMVRSISLIARKHNARFILQEFDPDQGTLDPEFEILPATRRSDLIDLSRESMAETYIRTRKGGLEFIKPRP